MTYIEPLPDLVPYIEPGVGHVVHHQDYRADAHHVGGPGEVQQQDGDQVVQHHLLLVLQGREQITLQFVGYLDTRSLSISFWLEKWHHAVMFASICILQHCTQ